MARDFLSDFLAERGIDPDGDVARERGYAAYAPGDVDAVYASMERLAAGLMSNAGGRRNPKYRVLDHLYPIRPQLRPKDPVVEREWTHNHSENAVDAAGSEMSPSALRDHVASRNRKKEHDGVIRNPERTHTHFDTARYGISLREESYRSQGRVDVADLPQVSLYWTNPGAVACDRLNGTRLNRSGMPAKIEPTLLLVASEPASAGFRLASIPELIKVHAEFHATPIDRDKARTLSVRAI